MYCDWCKRERNEIINLDKRFFTPMASERIKKLERVCFECARDLARKKLYTLRRYWSAILMRGDW